MPLYNSLNREILHSLRFHCVLSRFLLDGEGTNKDERNIRFSFSTPNEITRGLKRIWESKTGTPSSARITQDVYLLLKALEMVYRANGAAVEGMDDRNGHRRKLVGKGESVSWGDARTKGKGRECQTTKNIFLHSDLLKLCLKKNTTSLTSSLTPLYCTIRKLALQTNEIKIWRAINQSNLIIHTFDLR